jgi:hypothetical protein
MQSSPWRRLVATMLAAVLILSTVGHHVMAAGMAAEGRMAMQSQATDMTVHDADAPCPMSSDCATDTDMQAMACFAQCATVVGVLAEPALVSGTAVAHPLGALLVRPLVSLHGPPDSPPPKTIILT